jgi:hypothetical protein
MSDAVIIEKTAKLLLDLKKKYGEQTEWINTLQQKLNTSKQLNVCGKVYQNLSIQCLNSKQYQEASASSKTAIVIFTKIGDTDNTAKCLQLRARALGGLSRSLLAACDNDGNNGREKSSSREKIAKINDLIATLQENITLLCASLPECIELVSLQFERSQLQTYVFFERFDEFRKCEELKVEEQEILSLEISELMSKALKAWESSVLAERTSSSSLAQERKSIGKNTLRLLSEISAVYELVPQRLSALSLLEHIEVDRDVRFALTDQLLALGFTSAAQHAFQHYESPVASDGTRQMLSIIRDDSMHARLMIHQEAASRISEVFSFLLSK